jgi:hypothetical protein
MKAVRLSFLIATVSLSSGCDLLNTPKASAQQKVSGANAALGTLVETARLGAYSNKSSFVNTAPKYGEIISSLKFAALELAPQKASQKPRANLIKVIQACADRVTALSEVHKRFGLAANRAYEIFTADCILADTAIKEQI